VPFAISTFHHPWVAVYTWLFTSVYCIVWLFTSIFEWMYSVWLQYPLWIWIGCGVSCCFSLHIELWWCFFFLNFVFLKVFYFYYYYFEWPIDIIENEGMKEATYSQSEGVILPGHTHTYRKCIPRCAVCAVWIPKARSRESVSWRCWCANVTHTHTAHQGEALHTLKHTRGNDPSIPL